MVGLVMGAIATSAVAESVTFNRAKLSASGIYSEPADDIEGVGYIAGVELQYSLTSMFVLELGAGQRRDFYTVSNTEHTLVENYYAYGARAVFGIGSGDMALSLAGRAVGGELASDDLPLVGSETEVGYRWAEIGLHHLLLGPWAEGSLSLRRYLWGNDSFTNAVHVEYIQGATRLLWGVQGEVATDLSFFSAGINLSYAL